MDTVRYFTKDLKTQVAAPMTDALHKCVWGRISYSNRPFDGAQMVESADPVAWIFDRIETRGPWRDAAEHITGRAAR